MIEMEVHYLKNFMVAAFITFLGSVALNCSYQQPVRGNSRLSLPQKITRRKIAPHSSKQKARKKIRDKSKPELAVSLAFQNALLTDVLQVIGREFKVNLVIPNERQSRVTVSLHQATLPEALDMILSSLDYAYIKRDDTYFILKKNERVSRVYTLKYAEAFQMQQILQGISQSGHIRADEQTNSIVIVDELANMRTYDEIIARIDAFQPSVLIEAELFEVSRDNMKNLGVEWNVAYNQDQHEAEGTLPFSLSTSGIILDYRNLKSPQIQLLLKALRRNVQSTLLSSPRIVAMNGQEAKILIGERVPYIKTSTATTAGNVLEQVEFVDVGILLRVIPRILTEENLVFLDVQPEVSNVLDQEVQGVPRIGTREASTRIAVKNGETAVIGGLIKNDRVQSNSSIPILGEIPLLNLLFKNWNTTLTKRELIVFITPHILTSKHYKIMTNKRNSIQKKFNGNDSESNLSP
ncbi:hypothetical protein GF337_11700 [candidate division KSB1 bacterium]|nr:hypothetical protein [candidate division KSB1 bacterium]